VAYDASEVGEMLGKSSSALPADLRRPVVHADDLVTL
jgi:glutamate 5-kinase